MRGDINHCFKVKRFKGFNFSGTIKCATSTAQGRRLGFSDIIDELEHLHCMRLALKICDNSFN